MTCMLFAVCISCKKHDANQDLRLIDAAKHSWVGGTEKALNEGADANVRENGNGFTPLMLASEKGAADLVTLLLSQGAKPNLGNGGGYTPLMVAAGQGKAKVVELLLVAGANPNAKSEGGSSALGEAYLGFKLRGQREDSPERIGFLDTITLLKKAGATE